MPVLILSTNTFGIAIVILPSVINSTEVVVLPQDGPQTLRRVSRSHQSHSWLESRDQHQGT